jgi:hypothetical protein
MPILVVCLFALCSSFLSAEEIGGVSFSLDIPGEQWKVGNTFKNGQQEMTTYVHEQESNKQWSEIVTAQIVRGLQIEPRSFYDLFLEQLKVIAPPDHLHSKIIKQDSQELFAEWWIEGGTPEDQHEWLRMLRNKGNMIVVRFTTKKLDELEKSKATGNSILDTVKITN